VAPSCEQLLGPDRARWQWSQLRDWLAGASDRDLLAARCAVHDVATAIAQVSNAHLGHEP